MDHNNIIAFFNTTTSTCEVCSLSTKWTTFILLVMIINFILTVPTGSWSIWLLTRSSRATLEAEFFLLHLFCMNIACVFLNIHSFFNFYVLCKPKTFTAGIIFYQICLHGLPVFQCCVCVERYLAVVHPVTFLKYKPFRYKVACLCLGWLGVLFIESIHLIVFSTLTLLIILVPVVCIESFCSLSILWVLKRSKPGNATRNRDCRGEGNLMKKKAFIIISLLLFNLLLNELPVIMVGVLRSTVSFQTFRCNMYSIVTNICYFGSFIQPFLYLHRAGKLSFV